MEQVWRFTVSLRQDVILTQPFSQNEEECERLQQRIESILEQAEEIKS